VTAKVIIVDGPMRGETCKLDSPYQMTLVLPIPNSNPGSFSESVVTSTINTVVYQIHRLRLFGEMLLVGSVDFQPRDYDLFEALASNLAKDAVLR